MLRPDLINIRDMPVSLSLDQAELGSIYHSIFFLRIFISSFGRVNAAKGHRIGERERERESGAKMTTTTATQTFCRPSFLPPFLRSVLPSVLPSGEVVLWPPRPHGPFRGVTSGVGSGRPFPSFSFFNQKKNTIEGLACFLNLYVYGLAIRENTGIIMKEV